MKILPITRAGVVKSHDKYESYMETLDILSDPNAIEDIKCAKREIKQGNYTSLDDLKTELSKHF